jgi:uncharacterized protein
MTKIVLILLSLAAFFLILVFMAEVMKQQSMFFPERFPGGNYTFAGSPPPADVFFETSDAVRLHAWFFRADAADAPLLIWFHGNGGNLTYRAPMAAELARRGISVFLFDWRGYGKSLGTPSERSLFRDAIAAYDHAAAAYGKDRRVVLYGESLGGPYAAHVARERTACAVVIENSFSSLAALADSLYSPVPVGVLTHRSLRTADWLRASKVPTLVMHGRNDEVIPFDLGVAIYDALDQQKEMFVSERANHSAIPDVEGARYYDAVVNFVARQCNR